MRIAVIGCGYVGLVSGACLAEIGHDVLCVDTDAAKIAALQSGQSPIYERFLPELLRRHGGHKLNFTTSTQEAVTASDVVMIAVATPSGEDGMPDLSCVDAAVAQIARSMNKFKLIVQKSTVPVTAGQWVHELLTSRGVPASRFEVASNPEFLREGTAVTDFLYPDRIVLGCDSERASKLMRQMYQPLLSGSYQRGSKAIARPNSAQSPAKPQLIETSRNSAELIKYAANAYLSMKISFINAVAGFCEAIGANVEEVAQGMGTDVRIGPHFLRAGLGYGGSCFPKDVAALRFQARQWGCDFGLLDEVTHINEEQQQRFLDKVRNAIGHLEGKRLGVLGLSFKGGTDDTRYSPAIRVVKALLQEQAEIVAFDPAATERARLEIPPAGITYVRDAYTAARNADALLILTDWDEFARLDLSRLRGLLRSPVLVDGRNLYDPKQVAAEGLSYYSVGRPHAIHELPVRDAEAEVASESAAERLGRQVALGSAATQFAGD
ncbi:MAG TPA: UDP-glucose/GDP-mannose dehydrogenase family protein [Candidatus Angelobacter sp.]